MEIFSEDIDWINKNTPKDQGLVKVNTIGNGSTSIPNFWSDKMYTVRITSDPKCEIEAELIDLTNPKFCWSEGRKHFELLDEAGNSIADYIFYSSYGSYDIDVIDLNDDGKMEFIFVFGEGRGTNARRENLGVYEVVQDGLKKVYSTKYSLPFGLVNRWSYERYYRDTDANGTIDLELILDYGPLFGHPRAESLEMLPKEETKVFRYAVLDNG